MAVPITDTLFPSTQWSLLQKLREGSEAEARAALEALCRAYWQPLYCVARRRPLSEHDAQDAVQGFFESLLRRETFAIADEAAGKLRQLLLRAFDNFCTQQWKKTVRQKRGGGAEHLILDTVMGIDKAEHVFQRCDPAQSLEVLYNREWANALLSRALEALRTDYAKRGWQERYDLLLGPLIQQGDETHLGELAALAGMTAGALRVMLHRMRAHYRSHIERELSHTLDTNDPATLRAEMQELFQAFSAS
jgi:DNA-directed RNA polymerase specialized sigma24 family protein